MSSRFLHRALWAFLTSAIPALRDVTFERFEVVCGGLGISGLAGAAAGSVSLALYPQRAWHGAAAILG